MPEQSEREQLLHDARVAFERRLYGATVGAERAEEHVAGLLALVTALQAENARLKAIACREVCDCPFGEEGDLPEAEQMDRENHMDDCSWRLLAEAWEEAAC